MLVSEDLWYSPRGLAKFSSNCDYQISFNVSFEPHNQTVMILVKACLGSNIAR